MLLVLDLDGCILDTGSWKLPELATELFARPYLHDMLAAISPFYDVIIWSQTAWVWLERKIIELEMIGPTARGNYHIVSCLDKTCMFSVYSEKEGKAWSHQVKALGIIWANMPQYVPEKTVHLDDLSRNFAMNPKNGIKCHAYKVCIDTGVCVTNRRSGLKSSPYRPGRPHARQHRQGQGAALRRAVPASARQRGRRNPARPLQVPQVQVGAARRTFRSSRPLEASMSSPRPASSPLPPPLR